MTQQWERSKEKMSVGRGFNTPISTKTAVKDEITSTLRAGTPHTSRGKYV